MLGRLVVGLVVRCFRWLPARVRLTFARGVGALAWGLHIRRAVSLDNVRQALPELSADARRTVARDAYRSMAVAMMESVTSDLLSDAQLAAAVAVTEWKGLDVLLRERRPVLIASAHLGSWELFAEVMARRGYVFSAVVRPLTGAFNEWIVKNREQAGVELILQRGALRRMLSALERGRAVVQLIDQALPSPQAVWVPFFGRLASTTPALSMAALHSGAPVYVVVAVREGAGLRMFVDGPVPMPTEGDRDARLTAHTAQLTALLEARIRAHPGQWLWLHRRWKGAPPSDRHAQQQAGLNQRGEPQRTE